MRGHHLLEDGRQQQQIHELRIELRPASLQDDPGRFLCGAAVAIATVVRDGVERVRDRDDARGERDPSAAQAARIAGAVPPLVVREHALRELRMKVGDRREHLRATDRVRRDLASLLWCQRARLVHDVDERFADLSDVVKERRQLDRAAILVVDANGVGDNERVGRDAPDVRAGLLVVRVDRFQQRFEGGGGEPLGAFPPAPLVNQPGARHRTRDKSQRSHPDRTEQETIFVGRPTRGQRENAERPHVSFSPARLQFQSPRTATGYTFLPQLEMIDDAIVTSKGARRWQHGHPWIYRSDVAKHPAAPAGVVRVRDARGKAIGLALWSPRSEISLRLLDADPSVRIDAEWWHERIRTCVARRASITKDANAYRLVHGEGDALPSLICDRYDRWIVVQLMSAGLEACRDDIMAAIDGVARPLGILARNDVPLRKKEGLSLASELLRGDVPRTVEVAEHGVRYLAAPWEGQKTGAFLDQRENRALVGSRARGRALDCFSYHGSFALHLARNADRVTALDSSAAALERAKENFALNGLTNIEPLEANAFDYLKDRERARDRFDTIVLDPPAFAKTRASLPAAIRGYKEINLRAMRLLSPGGLLFTASCSFHLTKPLFLEMLEAAAADAGRRIALREFRGQPLDHPEVLTIPETGYIKGALLEAMD
jgi:23S rRNA (cytosine1962-C5)-methyltransferase